ncbi:hypothetical protein V5O48_009511 [Marasmius crinis-equi]|uniref:Isopenicillin N synthase-like Fe(2+) 2OG dioxygenase domain-containing protein n=1 Tax=Marasmius crinis-equi TaxID=585013 RepID=A0ABR3FB88_9AGAR
MNDNPTLPPILHYTPAQPTKEPLDYADSPIIDLEQARTNPAAVAAQICNAMSTQGFLNIMPGISALRQVFQLFSMIASVARPYISPDRLYIRHVENVPGRLWLDHAADGKWRRVKYIENTIIVNAGDSLEFVSGGFYTATIHRTVQPPLNQHNVARLAIAHLNHNNNNVKLVPVVSQQADIKRYFEDDKVLTVTEWKMRRTLGYGNTKTELKEGVMYGGSKVQEQVVGVLLWNIIIEWDCAIAFVLLRPLQPVKVKASLSPT